MSERYKHLQGHLYYDTQDKVIVQHMGDRYVFVRHDRRVRHNLVADERRSFEKASRNLMPVQKGLYFDKNTKQVYKKSGNILVLFSKDRRRSSRPVGVERRKR